MCEYEIDWEALPAWVQGVGSVIAVFVAVWLYYRQKNDAITFERSRRKGAADVAAVFLICKLIEIKGEIQRLRAGMGLLELAGKAQLITKIDNLKAVLTEITNCMPTWEKLPTPVALSLGQFLGCMRVNVIAIELAADETIKKAAPDVSSKLQSPTIDSMHAAMTDLADELEPILRLIDFKGRDSSLAALRKHPCDPVAEGSKSDAGA